MKLDRVLFGSLLTIPTWLFLHRQFFPNRFARVANTGILVFSAILLAAAQTLYQYFLDFLPSPLLIVLTYYAVFSAVTRDRSAKLLAETALSYSASIVLGVAAAAFSSMLASLIDHSPSLYFIYAVKTAVQIPLLLSIAKICRKCNFCLSPALDRHSGPLIAVYCSYFICSYAATRLFNLKDMPALGASIVFSLVYSFLLALLWVKDRFSEKRDKAQLASDLDNALGQNSLLSQSVHLQQAQLHRYRKLVPGAGVSIGLLLDRLNQHPSDAAIRQDIQAFMAQYAEMQREMGIDAEMDIIRNMGYGSCGHLITDGIIYRLMAKAVQKNIHVLYHPHAPLTALEGTVSLSKAGNAIGDLLSNAIDWAAAGNSHTGRVFLHMEMVEGVFLVSVYDNGPLFPLHVLEQLGRRGVTTRTEGSGNGFPDIMYMLLSCGGSLDIIEFPPKDLYTKTVRLRFDGEGLFSVESDRRGAQRCLSISEQLGAQADEIKV